MGIDGYYDSKYKYKHHEQEYHSHNSYQDFVRSYNLSYILNKIKNNRDLKILFGIIAMILLAITLALLIIFIPLIIKLINFISQHGIQGVVDNISGFLNKIWKSAGN
jgi:uncharacterized membrane protein